MARPKEFDEDVALNAAVAVFSEHGFEGSSAGMLIEAMGIGRQSLYDTFGDKWRLYQAALRRYSDSEREAHLGTLRGGARAIEGIEAMLQRVVDTASQPCLGLGSLCEFGASRPDLTEIRTPAGVALVSALTARVREAQREGDIAGDLDSRAVAEFLLSTVAGIRIAGRGGADRATLDSLAALSLRALR